MRVSIGTKDKVQINMLNMMEESFYVVLQHVHKTRTNTATPTALAFIFCLFFSPSREFNKRPHPKRFSAVCSTERLLLHIDKCLITH